MHFWVHMSVYGCVWIYVCMPVLAHVKVRGKCQNVMSLFIWFSWDTELEALLFWFGLGEAAVRTTRETCPSCHPGLRSCICAATSDFLPGCWESRFIYSHFHSKFSYSLSQAPKLSSFNVGEEKFMISYYGKLFNKNHQSIWETCRTAAFWEMVAVK